VRRLFWLGLGVAVGVVAVRRVTRFARAWTTPQGLAEQAIGLGAAARGAAGDFADEVRATAARREAELRAQLGLTGAEGDAGSNPYVDDFDHDKDGQ
jgi:hypothetical protein